MSTSLAQFYRPTRVLLGDNDPIIKRYPNEVIGDAVRTAIQLNKLPGYALSADESGIDPEITNPNTFALLSYWTAKLFVAPTPDRYGFRTRAMSESFGSVRAHLQELELQIHRLENGSMFSAWMSYFTWLSGMAGLPLAEVLTDMTAEAPLWHATLTREGIRTLPNAK